MTPIYSSKRLDASGWYMFPQPKGELCVWDGGANRETPESEKGLWCPQTGTAFPRPAAFLDQIPKMPMYGWLEENHFHVMDFPHVEQVLNMTGRTTDNAVYYMSDKNGGPLHFFMSAMKGDEILGECEVASFVRCVILPEDMAEARRVIDEWCNDLGRTDGVETNEMLIRHPHSSWARTRNPLYATTQQPPLVKAFVRTLKLSNGFIDEVECWTSPETVVTVFPLYEGDQHPGNNVFIPKSQINLYIHEGTILGYDF